VEVEEIALKKNPNKLPPGHFDPSQGRSRMPPPLIFRYKVYKGLESPIIPIGLKSDIGWKKVWGYVDSGSIYSILHEGRAQRLGIEIEKGERRMLKVGKGGIQHLGKRAVPQEISSLL
jgi:hypothetical protein